MNKLKKVSVAAIVGLAIFGTTAFASTGKVYNTSQGLVLRGSASKSGAPLATVPNNEEVEILEDLGEWYKVNVNGKEGYLFAQYVKVEEPVDKPTTPSEEEPAEDNKPTENTEPNTVKTETKIYVVPLITATTIGTIPENTELTVERIINNWGYVSYGDVKGWIRTYNYNNVSIPEEPEQVPEDTPSEENPEPVVEEPEETNQPEENTNLSFTKGYINSSAVNVRKEPSTSSQIVTTLVLNTGVTITAQTDEWYKITYGNYIGYVYKPLISETPTATNRGSEVRHPEPTVEETPKTNEQTVVTPPTQTAPQETVTPPAQTTPKEETITPSVPSTSSAGEKIVTFAKQYLGYRYVYGGTTPSSGFDCSGFIYYVFNSCGYSVGRSITAQAGSGVAVSKSELQLGDVVFFNNTSSGAIGHVGIYIGDGRMIHAANSRRGVVTDTINSGYYNTYYYTARRIAY